MTIVSDQVPPGQDHLIRRIVDLERQVREIAAGRRLESATIGAGGIRVVDALGQPRIRIGQLGNGEFGLEAINADGEAVDLAALAFGQRSEDGPQDGEFTSTPLDFEDLPGEAVGPALTDVLIGNSGRCLVLVSCRIRCEVTGTGFSVDLSSGFAGYEITGATSRGPSETRSLEASGQWKSDGTPGHGAGGWVEISATKVVLETGLNPGNHDITMKYRALVGGSAGSKVTFDFPNISVIPF